ncbi:hypothetical protein [Yoonia sp. SDW83-1]|uniref:hypothetical protein n=1 Tax=Yoonia sp. SDW83-1 TaxID=3366945 RepID=UPI00398C333C
MNTGRHDIHNTHWGNRREALASRLFFVPMPALGLIVAAAQLGAEGVAETELEPIKAALELCLDVPEDREQFDLLITRAGWVRHPDAPMETVLSQVLASQWDSALDPLNLIGGAVMLAAQTIDYYELDGPPPGYRLNGHSIAIINIDRVRDSNPRCYLAGPPGLEDAILGYFDLPRSETDLGRRSLKWLAFGTRRELDVWEVEALESALATLPTEVNELPYFHVKPTNLRISRPLE